MKLWILAAPLLAMPLITGCPKEEQPQAEYAQPEAPQPTPTPEEAQPPAGWEQFGQAGEQPAQGGGVAEAPDFAEALGQLRTYAQEIRASQDPQHKDVVAGFNALSAAMRTLPNATGVDTSALANYAERLAASDPMASDHTNLAKTALLEGLRTLETILKAENVTGMDERLTQIRTQVEAIDDAMPLLQQKDAVANTFDQMAQVMDELAQRPPSGTQ